MEDKVLSIEQMQELKELGIDVSKASMCWIGCADGNDVYPYNSTFKDIFENHKETIPSVITPTFILQDILEMLPKRIDKDIDEEESVCYHLDIDFSTCNIGYFSYLADSSIKWIHYDNILDGAFKLLKWCKQNNCI